MRRLTTATLLLLVWWLIRLPSLESLPLHNDEGLHLTRAVEVWNLHPFWEIRDGKIVNHFVIALFYPQNAPVFVGRIATLFVTLIGMAAGYAFVRWRFGGRAALFGFLFWITSSYLLFYERLAFSDAEAGALVVLALWMSDRLARSGRIGDAIFTGLGFGTAVLFKFTALPFALAVAAIVLLTAKYPLAKRLNRLVVAGMVAAALFIIPLGYLLIRGDDLFSIALGWIGIGGSSGGFALFDNLTRLWATMIGYGLMPALMLMIGLILFAVAAKPKHVKGMAYGVSLVLPLAVILIFGREVLPRHFVVALPLALLLAGVGFAALIERMAEARLRLVFSTAVAGLLIVPFLANLPLQWAYPDQQPLPELERMQFVTEHSGGYGLREAVLSFPTTISQANTAIIGSMFPDGCRRANFYAVAGYTMTCTDAPGTTAIQSALDERGEVYVLTDTSPLIGADVSALAASFEAQAEQTAAYPRPGETADAASVVLWLLRRP